MDILNLPVSSIKGVGPKKEKLLKAIGINNIRDMLYYFPRDYEDRTRFYPIVLLPHGEKAGVRARVAGYPEEKKYNSLYIIKVPIEDSSGRGWAVWFNNPYIARALKRGREYDFFGKVDRRFEIQIQNPEVKEDTSWRRIVPVYPRAGKLTTRDFEKFTAAAVKMAYGRLEDIIPGSVREGYNLEEINYSIKNIHFPGNLEVLQRARRRLVFEELFLLQLGLLTIKRNIESHANGIVFMETSEEERFISGLPFKLTGAQKRAYMEIKGDMESSKMMNRLLQGDVGSGKTVIAVMALLKAAANGYQGALMVPTEILAEQHFSTIRELLRDFDVKADLLVGSCPDKERERIYRDLEEGNTQIVVGTHALIQDNLQFKKLGLVITDEQHRFGVRQRAALFGKGINPDVLVMTATPIPRTLALVLYGDMDISIIDQMPPGRKKVETYAVDKSLRDRVYRFVLKQIAEGRQAYIVCPLIEESEQVDAVSATEMYDQLVKSYFKGHRVELIHGKMPGQKKDKIMRDFRDGKVDILVSTTVIEVGVNVPNANVMVIENAERYGLAQLHQLRGRVGRGQHQSYCILINESKSKIARERMKIMVTTSDGFKIAEKDLALRGPGDFFGTRQHGLPDLRLANFPGDMDILKDAQKLALSIIKEPELLDSDTWKPVLEKLELYFRENNLPHGLI